LDELMRLVAAEQDCCQFFQFAITVDQRGIALEVRAPADAQAIITTIFGVAYELETPNGPRGRARVVSACSARERRSTRRTPARRGVARPVALARTRMHMAAEQAELTVARAVTSRSSRPFSSRSWGPA
jgi:hypothetical protein